MLAVQFPSVSDSELPCWTPPIPCFFPFRVQKHKVTFDCIIKSRFAKSFNCKSSNGCRMAISFFFCLLFLFQQKETKWKREFHAFPAERQILFSFACFFFQQKETRWKRWFHAFPAEWQSLFSFAYFSFFSKKKPDEKDDSTLSLPNGKFFFLLPAFLFLAKRNQMKKMIPRFPCRTANSFFFCLLFFF